MKENQYLSNAVRDEYSTDYCRESIVIAAGSGVIPITALLGKITATGKYAAHNPAETNGTETVAGILCSDDVDATSSDVEAVALVQGPAIVLFSECARVYSLSVAQENAAKNTLTGTKMRMKVK